MGARTVTVAGEDIHCTVVGRGPPVLLMHSLGGADWVWDRLRAHLGAAWTLIAYDAPGHGHSSYRQRFSIDRCADVALAVLDACCSTPRSPALLLGVSMGAHTALRLSRKYPDRVKALVLANMSIGAKSDPQTYFNAYRDKLESEGMDQFALNYSRSRMKNGASPEMVAEYAKSVREMAPGAFLDAYASILVQDHVDQLATLNFPTLVIGSDADVSTPEQEVRRVADGIATSQWKLIFDANHFAYLDQPDAFNAEVARFLDCLLIQ